MKTTRTMADVKLAAKRLGATLHKNSTAKVWDYTVEAPRGKVWNCSEVHELVLNQAKGNVDWLLEAIDDLLDRMEQGVSDCTNPDCEWCNSGGNHV